MRLLYSAPSVNLHLATLLNTAIASDWGLERYHEPAFRGRKNQVCFKNYCRSASAITGLSTFITGAACTFLVVKLPLRYPLMHKILAY